MRLTPRGRKVVGILAILGVILMYAIITQIWYVGPDAPTNQFLGYCFGNIFKCNEF